MSLTVGPNLSAFYGSEASGSALTGRGTAAGRQSALSSENADQTNQTSQTDQINITSITVNITQQTSGLGDGQLRLEVDKVDPAGNGGGADLQPYAEGYFSSPSNFVPTGNDGTTSPQATSEASITLQILSVATASTEAINQQTPGGADLNVTASHRAAPSGGSYRSIDISI